MYVSGQGLSGSTEPDPDAIRDWVQGVSVLTNEPVYVPVEIEPRTLVPRVIRDDARYAPELKGRG